MVILILAILSGCQAMSVKTERDPATNTLTSFKLKSKREYKDFHLTYNPDTGEIEIHASEVRTGDDQWAPVVLKMLDTLPLPN